MGAPNGGRAPKIFYLAPYTYPLRTLGALPTGVREEAARAGRFEELLEHEAAALGL